MARLLVIFDCDGVLVDSEPIANCVLAELATELGLPMDVEAAHARFLGATIPAVADALEAELGRPLGLDFVQAYSDRLHVRLRTQLRPVEGVREALALIPDPVCVASNGEPETIRLSLRVTKLAARFEQNIFSARDAGRGKPHPDLFLFSARTMGFEPHQCVVVEDSALGVEGARAAGMPVLGYASNAGPKGDHGRRLAAAGANVFADMGVLPALVAEAEKRMAGPQSGPASQTGRLHVWET